MNFRLSPVVLAAFVTIAGCGGGDDSDSSVADTAGSPTPTVTVTVSATPKVAKPKPSGTPSAPTAVAGAVTPAATPKPAKQAPAKPAYRVAMPDGRTSPTLLDWSFGNLKIEPRPPGFTGTVDVTYNGPGLASMDFTAVIDFTDTWSDGTQVHDSATFKGSVTNIAADATETVRLLGGNEKGIQEGRTYEGHYSVDSVTDDDPKARAE